jgi:dipeptidyl-peptidase-4
VLDPKISPKGRYVSFVRDQNLYVIDLSTGKEKQLTTDGKDTIHNGEAEFVAQEEMGQTSGYYWAPDDSAIAYKRYDEAQCRSRAALKSLPTAPTWSSSATLPPAIRMCWSAEHRFAGDGRDPQRRPGRNPDIYLVRADWSGNAKALLFQRQSRDQKKLELVAVDAATLAQRVLVTETSPTWVSIFDDLRFLSGDRFIWSSERSGRKHLYLYDMSGKQLHAISSGEWGIDRVLAVDEKRPRVRAIQPRRRDRQPDLCAETRRQHGQQAGPRDAGRRLARHRLCAQRRSVCRHLFEPGHAAASEHPPSGRQHGEWLEHNELNASHPYGKYLDAHLKTEYGTLKAKDGQTLYYSMIKPAASTRPKSIRSTCPPTAARTRSTWRAAGAICSTSTWRSKASSSGAWTTVVRRAASAPSPTPTTTTGQGGSGRLTGIEWLGQQTTWMPSASACSAGAMAAS